MTTGESAAVSGQGSPVWADAVAAVTLLAVDPVGLGGLRLVGPADPARDRLVAIYLSLLPEGAPVRKLPPAIGDARLLGGLDLSATLAARRPVLARGLLAEADGGALLIPGAERLSPALAGRIASVLDLGVVATERDGFGACAAARFAILACDEALADQDPVPQALADRLGLVATHVGATRECLSTAGPDAAAIALARVRLPRVAIDDAAVAGLADAALRFGVTGLRPLMFACAAARASAALAGRIAVEADDLALAARLVIGPRAVCLPQSSDAAEAQEAPEQGGPSDPTDTPADDDGPDGDPREMADRMVEAALASLPPGLLTGEGVATRSASAGGGKAGAAKASKRRGRPIGARPGAPGDGARLDLVETLRAAAPWQAIRRREDDDGRIKVLREDFRIQRLKERRRTLTIFAVDASGSAALHRLAEAKGAVELLLAQAYVRRDEVALVAFRGTGADVLLPPTRSLARAKRSLAGLPGGGGTPLASGLDAAAALGDVARRRGDTPMIVLLTDGHANVARDGAGGRARAQDDAMASAKAFRAQGFSAVLIDVSPRPQARARELADAMAARYVALPSGDAAALARAVAA